MSSSPHAAWQARSRCQRRSRFQHISASLRATATRAVYPDSTDVLSQDPTTKVWTITTDNGDHVATSYDRMGRKTGTTDQRGVVHEYAFDSAGRPSADTVTSLGSTGLVDGSVRRIGSTYDDLGRVQTVTSYSDTSGGVHSRFCAGGFRVNWRTVSGRSGHFAQDGGPPWMASRKTHVMSGGCAGCGSVSTDVRR